MFSCKSGFISGLNLNDNAQVYVFLLMPRKFIKLDNDELFDHSHHSYCGYEFLSSSNDVTTDVLGNYCSSHYVPFAFPFKARFERDTGVYLEEKSDITEWLEDKFEINLADYLGKLSEARYCSEERVTKNNIFDFMAVAFEHVSIVDGIVEAISKDANYIASIERYSDFTIWDNELTLTQGHITGKNLSLIDKSALESMDLIYEKMAGVFAENKLALMSDLKMMHAIEYFMDHANKVYKPCSKGHQANQMSCFEILHSVRLDCIKSLDT